MSPGFNIGQADMMFRSELDGFRKCLREKDVKVFWELPTAN